jgi:hypothetical protein
MSPEGSEVLIVAVAGRFELPPAGSARGDSLPIAAVQRPAPRGDEFTGEPGKSSLRCEGQGSLPRLGTDVYIQGHARAPRGRAVKEMLVNVRVGPCQFAALVVGDRVWRRGGATPVASAPASFAEMPLVYERSFGGACPSQPNDPRAFDPRNPVGRGFYVDDRAALDRPLPNVEQLERRVDSPRDRPTPCNFGPIARHWLPRARLGGTYDEAWLARRAPLWPTDLDRRFFSAAPAPLQAPGYFQGGEALILTGMSPDGDVRATLPRWQIEAKSITRKHIHRVTLNLDAVLIEPDDGVVTLIWRGAIPVDDLGGMGEHEVTTIRAHEMGD